MSTIVDEKCASTASHHDRRLFWLGCLLSALGAMLFATKGVIIKLAYAENIDAVTLLALRMALAAPVYLGIGFFALRRQWRGSAPRVSRGLYGRAIVLGLLGSWLSSYLNFLGLEYVSAQFERLILFTYPLFVVLFSALLYRQRVRPRALLAFAVSYAGLGLAFADNVATPAGGSAVALGSALVLASAVTYALYQVLAKPTIAAMGAQLFTCVVMSAASFGAIAQFLLTHPLGALAVSQRVLALSALIALVATILPTFLINAALGRIPAAVNATIGMLSPVVTLGLAVLVLGETLSLAGMAGTVLVIAGVGAFVLADRR